MHKAWPRICCSSVDRSSTGVNPLVRSHPKLCSQSLHQAVEQQLQHLACYIWLSELNKEETFLSFSFLHNALNGNYTLPDTSPIDLRSFSHNKSDLARAWTYFSKMQRNKGNATTHPQIHLIPKSLHAYSFFMFHVHHYTSQVRVEQYHKKD